jgi:hypothetical protein
MSFTCPDCKKFVPDKKDTCPKCGRKFTEEEFKMLTKKGNREALLGLVLIGAIIAAVWFFFFRGESQTPAPEAPVVQVSNFTPSYTLDEIEDISVARAKRFTARITVPEKLDRETLAKNVEHVAWKVLDEQGAKAVTVFAYREKDEVRYAYSAATGTLAPLGEIANAIDPKMTRKDLQIKIRFDENYFEESSGAVVIARIPEPTRRQIFKEIIGAERRSKLDAMRALIKKYTGESPAQDANEDTLMQTMNKIYPRGIKILQEEGTLAEALQERYDKDVRDKYQLSEEEYEEIGLEGLLEKWSMGE